MRGSHRICSHNGKTRGNRRRGASTLDYILVLGVILPMVAIILPAGQRAVRLVYEMITVFVAWPFL